jgi:hypothetical protein
MNTGGKQALIRVNVTHACQERLIQQQRLDSRLPLDSLAKFIERDFEWLGTQPCNPWRNF